MARTQTRTIIPMGYSRPSSITVKVPRAPSAPRHKKRGRRRSGGYGARGGTGALLSHAVGGAVIGFIEKSEFNDKIPTLPVIGRKGAITFAAYMIAGSKRSGLAWDVAKAGATLCGYEFGKTGTVSGDDDFDM